VGQAFSNSQLDADLAVIIGDLPITITIAGSDVTATRLTITNEDELAIEGMRQHYEYSVFYRVADYAASVAVGDTVTVSGSIYRVMGKGTADDGRLVRLDLGERYAP
jgi:hypothetical protein